MKIDLPIEQQDSTATEDEARELDVPVAAAPDDDDDEYEEQEDGSVVIRPKKAAKRKTVESHDQNLVDVLDPGFVNKLGLDLADRIEQDIENRKERDKQQEEGIKRTGLSGSAPGGADFPGASKVTHPMLAKGCVDFASKAIKELYPAGGPVKTQIIGKQTDEKLSRAERKRQYMNWQLTTRVAENRAEFERLLSQLPLGGACYKRWWPDKRMHRPRTETVFIDDVFIPYNCNDFYTAYRVTHRQYISKLEFERRCEDGLYIDPGVGDPPTGIDEKSGSRKASEDVEGVEEESGGYNDEGVREVYTCYCDIDGEDTEGEEIAPYIVHLDKFSKKVLGIYRNWDEESKSKEKLHWMVEYIFIPWRGPHGIGLNHLIGSMAVASTGALRALLDSAHINNFPGGLKLKSGRTAGQTIQINATELTEIDAPPTIDDIRKLAMPFPFNGPSTVLYTLLEWLTDQADTVVATANEKIADGGTEMPVGTALALIEQGSVNFSAIHSRLHASLKMELAIVHRLNADLLDDEETVEELGELAVYRSDFEGPVDVIPVSDPNIFSESQRYAQLQAVMQLAGTPSFAQFFKPDKLLRKALKLLNATDVDEFSQLPPDPSNIDAIEENYVITLDDPLPLKVFDGQDDYEHLMAHTHFLSSPMFGQNPLIAPVVLPPLIKHCMHHMMSLYKKHTKAAAEVVQHVARLQGKPMTDHEAHAKGAAFADQVLSRLLGPQIMPVLGQAAQQAKAMMPPPPADPNKQAEIAARQATEQAQIQSNEKIESNKLTYQQQKDSQDRAANAQAALMAQQSEAAQSASAERLAQFQQQGKEKLAVLQAHLAGLQKQLDASIAKDVDGNKSQETIYLELLQQQGAQQLAALQFIFDTQTALAAPVQKKNADGSTSTTPGKVPEGMPALGEVLTELLRGITENNALVERRLGEQTQMLQALSQPRVSEFVYDEKGRKKGIRTSVAGSK